MSRKIDRPDLDAFHAHLDYLKLPFIREHHAEFVKDAAADGADHLALLMRLVEGEAQLRRDRSVERRIRLARFPVRKTLDQFDWSWPRKINRLQVQNLFRLHFVTDRPNGATDDRRNGATSKWLRSDLGRGHYANNGARGSSWPAQLIFPGSTGRSAV